VKSAEVLPDSRILTSTVTPGTRRMPVTARARSTRSQSSLVRNDSSNPPSASNTARRTPQALGGK